MRQVSLAELAKHSEVGDCWMAVHGRVYDVTAYLDEHPGERPGGQGSGGWRARAENRRVHPLPFPPCLWQAGSMS
jgi:predicted heme/steroid binding protein